MNRAQWNKLADKFADTASEIRGAMSDMQQADNTAGAQF